MPGRILHVRIGEGGGSEKWLSGMLVLSKAPEFQKDSEEKNRRLHEKSLFIILGR